MPFGDFFDHESVLGDDDLLVQDVVLVEPSNAMTSRYDLDGHDHAVAYNHLALDPGAGGCLHDFLSQPDALTNTQTYQFEAFTFPQQGNLVDINADGIADQTIWGTPVIEVEAYQRADGTWVRGHYRTVPDGCISNNLGSN